MVKPMAQQPRRRASSTPPWTGLIPDAVGKRVGAVDLEDRRDLAGIAVSALLQHAERGGIAGKPGIDRELVEIMRVVGGGIGGEAAGGAVLIALIDGQDHQLAGAGQASLHHQAGEIGLNARAFAFIPGQDFLDLRSHLHWSFPIS